MTRPFPVDEELSMTHNHVYQLYCVSNNKELIKAIVRLESGEKNGCVCKTRNINCKHPSKEWSNGYTLNFKFEYSLISNKACPCCLCSNINLDGTPLSGRRDIFISPYHETNKPKNTNNPYKNIKLPQNNPKIWARFKSDGNRNQIRNKNKNNGKTFLRN